MKSIILPMNLWLLLQTSRKPPDIRDSRSSKSQRVIPFPNIPNFMIFMILGSTTARSELRVKEEVTEDQHFFPVPRSSQLSRDPRKRPSM